MRQFSEWWFICCAIFAGMFLVIFVSRAVEPSEQNNSASLESHPDYLSIEKRFDEVYQESITSANPQQRSILEDEHARWFLERETLKNDPEKYIAYTEQEIRYFAGSYDPPSNLTVVTSLAMATQAQDDKSFFAGTHLRMTIEQCEAFYHNFGNIDSLGHSGAPRGEAQVDFRTSAAPQRRVYVFYGKSNGIIVSVMYWKMGENETFSKDEIQVLTGLNQGRGSLVTQLSENGSEFEVTTPRQFQLEQAQEDPMIKNHD
jgi:hypothetical protein